MNKENFKIARNYIIDNLDELLFNPNQDKYETENWFSNNYIKLYKNKSEDLIQNECMHIPLYLDSKLFAYCSIFTLHTIAKLRSTRNYPRPYCFGKVISKHKEKIDQFEKHIPFLLSLNIKS